MVQVSLEYLLIIDARIPRSISDFDSYIHQAQQSRVFWDLCKHIAAVEAC